MSAFDIPDTNDDNDFSWDYVRRTTRAAVAELGRSTISTIAAAVDPGIYVVEPDAVYEIRVDGDATVVLRNGHVVSGDAFVPEEVLVAVAAEMGGIASTRRTTRSSIEFIVSA